MLNIDYNWMKDNVDNIPESIVNLISYTMQRVKDMGLYCDLYAQVREINEAK